MKTAEKRKERWEAYISIGLLALVGFAFIKKLYDDVCNSTDHAESITEIEQEPIEVKRQDQNRFPFSCILRSAFCAGNLGVM